MCNVSLNLFGFFLFISACHKATWAWGSNCWSLINFVVSVVKPENLVLLEFEPETPEVYHRAICLPIGSLYWLQSTYFVDLIQKFSFSLYSGGVEEAGGRSIWLLKFYHRWRPRMKAVVIMSLKTFLHPPSRCFRDTWNTGGQLERCIARLLTAAVIVVS